MDGVYDPDHLCFVLSQYDRDYSVPNYLAQNHELNESLKPVHHRLAELSTNLNERQALYRATQESYEANTTQIEILQAQIEKLYSKSSLHGNFMKGLKRKHDELKGKWH